MKKITLLLSLFLTIGLATQAQTNLVTNPSFEDGFNGWSKGPTSSYTEPTIMTDGGQSGANYAHYVATATTGFHQDIPVTTGKTYILSFWYKSSGDDTDSRLWSYLMNADGKYVYATASPSEDPLRTNNGYLPSVSEWTKHEATFTVPATVVSLRLAIRVYGGGTGSFDNFSLTESGSSTSTLSVNPGSLSFNSVVGTATDAQTVTVSAVNTTSAPTYTVTGTDAAMFAATGTLGASGGTISVTFTPTSAGSKSAMLTVSEGDLKQEVALTGVATDASNPYGLDDSKPVNSLFEDFEGSNSNIPTGWTGYAAQGDRSWEVRNYKENNYMQMSAFKGSGAYQILLISPAINFDALSQKDLKFDWKSAYTNGATIKVYVMDKNGNKTEVKTVNDNQNPSGYGADFSSETVDLSAFSGVKFIAFEYNGDENKTTTYQIDNIKVPSTTSALFTPSVGKLTVWKKDNQLIFKASANEQIEIYNVAGQKIVSTLATDGLNQVSLPATGVMIVKAGNKVGKVIF